MYEKTIYKCFLYAAEVELFKNDIDKSGNYEGTSKNQMRMFFCGHFQCENQIFSLFSK